MTLVRLSLALLFVVISGYTAITISNEGLNLFPAFFGDMAKMGWPGQFNVDFSIFLILSATWLAWRHHFSATGLIYGLCGFFLGTFFLTAYLLVISFKANGDITEMLIGRKRATP